MGLFLLMLQLTKTFWTNLIESLPRRVEAIIAAKGESHFNAFILYLGLGVI